MKIYRSEDEQPKLIKPIKEFRYIIGDDGKETDIMINEDSIVTFSDGTKAKMRTDVNGRLYVNLNLGRVESEHIQLID